MANPYPAVFRDGNSETRLSGKVDFTDMTNQPGGGILSATGTLALADMAQWATVGFPILPDPGAGTTVAIPLMGFANFKQGAHAPTLVQSPDIIIIGDVAGNGNNLLTFAAATYGALGTNRVFWAPTPASELEAVSAVGGGLFVFGSVNVTGYTVAGSNPTLEVTILYFLGNAPL